MNGSVPYIRFASLAVARNLKLVFRAPMCFFEDHGGNGNKLSRVVLSIGAGQTIQFIHVNLSLWDVDATTEVANSVAIGIVIASTDVEGHAENSARLPDNIGLPITCLR